MGRKRVRIAASCRESADLSMADAQDPHVRADDRSTFSAALYRLMAWLSPAYPVGAFSYSSGLEWAVEAGDITTPTTLRSWLAADVRTARGFCDAVFFAHAYRAVRRRRRHALARGRRACGGLGAVAASVSGDDRAGPRFHRGDARGLAVRGARSLRRNLARTRSPIRSRSASPPPAMAFRSSNRAARLSAGARGELVSAGVRLIPLGQTDGQRVTGWRSNRSSPRPPSARSRHARRIGGAAFRADIASMRHETQYTRLFRAS